MSVLTVKDFFLAYIKLKYVEKSNIIQRLTCHIGILHTEFIINNTERNKYMRDLTDILKLLSNTYNSKCKIIKTDTITNVDSDDSPDSEHNNISLEKAELDSPLSKFINIRKIEELTTEIIYQLANTNKLSTLCDTYFNFNDIDEKLSDIIKNIGAGNIEDIVMAFTEKKDISTDNDLYHALIDIFIPTSSNIEESKGKGITIIPHVASDVYEILLNNFYKITLHTQKKNKNYAITVFGYFILDNLNVKIRTSQLCDKFINDRKKLLVDLLDPEKYKSNAKFKSKLRAIPSNFIDVYIKNITIGDLLITDKLTFINKLFSDYELYQKYSISNNFRPLFSEFIKANLVTKFNIIRCLLMGPVSSSNNAGLLWSLTRDSKNGATVVADIIYKNLNFTSQIKLHKSNNNIKSELDKLNNLDVEDVDIKKQIILNPNIPQRAKKLALEKLEEMKAGNSEYYKQLQFVKVIAEYPWIGQNDEDIFTIASHDTNKWKDIIKNTHNKLHEKVYGHNECKETIIELLGKWLSNPNSLGKAIGLHGPPGVGKTLLAKGLGDALNMPYTQINLGGMEDGAVLTGHSITYSGAVPGLIVKKMIEAGKPRCIMFFDELDKACFRHGRNEIYDILIHVVDPNSNAEFNDKFFQDIRFPINKVLFVFSFNDKSKIDRVLLDRLEIIDVKAYSMEDKYNIAQNFLLKELTAEYKLLKPKININDDALAYIIESYTFEAGVRDLRTKIEKIIRKLNIEKIDGSGYFLNKKQINSMTITKDMIKKYLGKSYVSIKSIHPLSEVGITNGLYATTLGIGGLIPILLYKIHNGNSKKFKLKLTGKQGVVMKESVVFAFTIATNIIKKKYIDIFFDAYPTGLNVHTPDGATDKDGPSAGCAFTLAFISKILNKKIKRNISMTGELELNGMITAIGGLEYKLVGAKRAGVNLVFVPKENEQDIDKIKITNKTLFTENFRYILVSHIVEIADLALIENNIEYADVMVFDKLFDTKKYCVDKLTEMELPEKYLTGKHKKNLEDSHALDTIIINS